jgi:hypothetical protein
MQQSRSMQVLEVAGLRTPRSFNATGDSLRHLELRRSAYYYCRGVVGGEKYTRSLLGRDVSETLLAIGNGVDWLIQPLLDFPLSGAAYVEGSMSYVEST